MGSVTTTLTPTQGVQIDETGKGSRRKVVVTFRDHVIAAVDDTGVDGRVTEKLFTFPEGVILFEGAVANFTAQTYLGDGTTTGIFNTFDGDLGLGTVAAASGATLATTEQDFIPTTATTQAVAGSTTVTGASTSTEAPVIFDGSSTAKECHLNILIDDADHNIAGVSGSGLKLNGTITLHFTKLGDK
jgi:hypothetical protein